MSEQIVEHNSIEASYHRDNAAPLVLPKCCFSLGQLLQNRKREVIQIIGIEWRITDVDNEPHWHYVIWDVELGCVLELHHNRIISGYLPKRMGITYKE